MLADYIRRWKEQPKIRPWALAAPIILLLLCLPLLRPLRYPTAPAADEAIRLLTIRSIVENGTFAVERVPSHRAMSDQRQVGTVLLKRRGDEYFSTQPPTFAAILSMPYALMRQWGITFESNPLLVAYLLTLIGTTLPAAAATGLIYRMARMFELPRWQRALLSLAVALGSGMGSYCTVLNPHVPAAALVLCSAACIIHWSRSLKPFRSIAWLSLSGFCAALGAVIDPISAIFLCVFIVPIFALRLGFPTRLAGALLFAGGAVVPLMAHYVITLRTGMPIFPDPLLDASIIPIDPFEDEQMISRHLVRLVAGLIGAHGAFSHFPLLIISIAGIGAVMHRHWPSWVKMLAAASGAGALTIYLIVCLSPVAWRDAMFACRWFLAFSPMLIFWCGAWMRQDHKKSSWITATCALAVSSIIGVIGMLRPWPVGGYEPYTVVGVLEQVERKPVTVSQR